MQQLTTTESYVDPIFEDYFKKLEREQLSAISIQAKQDGLMNKPTSVRHHTTQTITPLKSVIQKALDFNYSRHQPISDLAIAQQQRTIASDGIGIKEKQKNAIEKIVLQLKEECCCLKDNLNCTISPRLRNLIPVSFGISEGVLVFNILQSAAFPALLTFFLAIVIALASAVGLHLGANFIRKALTKAAIIKRYVIVLSLAFVVALMLGVWRANLYTDTVNINSQIDLNSSASAATSFSPWPFVLISIISFIVALAFEIKYWQSDEEKKNQKKYEDKSKELKNAEREYKDINKEIDTLKSTSSSESGCTIRKQEYACSNENRLRTLAQQLINHYEGINVEYRPDGDCPAFFGELINTDFKLYFSDIFNKLNQRR